uniref:Cyclin n=1 Tax=Leersia perrieri TaxID=77586 RepID=A0A0D9W9W5_9ORYZ
MAPPAANGLIPMDDDDDDDSAAIARGDTSAKQKASPPPQPPPELGMMVRAVQRLVARNDAAAAAGGDGGGGGILGMAAFEAAKGAAPRIGLEQYMERVHRYAGLEAECYVLAYAYVDMAAHRRPTAAVSSSNVHRLLLACLLLASKVLDDFHHNNAFFARVGGVSNAEMNKLELELLAVLDFEVTLNHRVYQLYRDHLHKEARRYGAAGGDKEPAVAPPAPLAPKLLDLFVAGDDDDGAPPNGTVNGWTAAAAAAANGVRLHSSSTSRYSFDCQ